MSFPNTYINQFNNSPIQPNFSSLLKVNATEIVTLEWPFLKPGTTTPFSQVILVEVLGASPKNKIEMPDATYAGIGQTIVVINKSNTICRVLDFEGNLIVSIPGTPLGESVLVTLTDNSTSEGTWSYAVLGATNTTGFAAALAGYGLNALGGETLNIDYTIYNFASQDVTYNQTLDDRSAIFVNAWGGKLTTFNCLSADQLTDGFYWTIMNLGENSINVKAPNGSAMNGSAGGSLILPRLYTATFVADPIETNIFSLTYCPQQDGPLNNIDQFSLECYSGVPTQEVTVQQAQSNIQQFVEGEDPPQANLTLIYPTNLNQIYYFWNKTTQVLNVQLQGGVNIYTLQPDATIACFSGSFNNVWDLYLHTSS